MTIVQTLRHRLSRFLTPDTAIRKQYAHFTALLRADTLAQDLIADLEAHLYGHDPADMARIRFLTARVGDAVQTMTSELAGMNPALGPSLAQATGRVRAVAAELAARASVSCEPPYIIDLDHAADFPDQAGGKAVNLSLARQQGAPTPPGFVITASAYARYMRENNLDEALERSFQDVSLANRNALVRAVAGMQEGILAGVVPEDIARQILDAVAALPHDGHLAVRSSALAEDGRISFAGQYASELDVLPADVLDAYKRVLAGKYCLRALAYRIRHGLTDADTAMAVLVLPMIAARAAGVVYTRDPACSAGGDSLGVYVVRGTGVHLVDGSARPGKYCLLRSPEPKIVSGATFAECALVPDSAVLELASWGLRLENFFGQAQDMEWALGPQGVSILQTRRLGQDPEQEAFSIEETAAASLLASGLDCASPGAACGPVWRAPHGAALQNIPAGSVLLTPTMRPTLSQFLDRVAAIVAASGSRASHLASVAREQGVPVLVGEVQVPDSEVVTVDAAAGRIFAGCLRAVEQREGDAAHMRAQVRARHEDLARSTVQLHLTDPKHEDFCPPGCRSLHDLVRFCHEQGVAAMFTLTKKGRGLRKARRLACDLPLAMYVLDLGGGIGLSAPARGEVQAEHLACVPLRALWNGLTDPGIAWDTSQFHVDWEEFDRISGGIFQADSKILASYAIISEDYMHLNIRFGYHFSLVDTLCGELDGTNYIRLRFQGGGAALEQRERRLSFLDTVLSRIGFDVRIKNDLLDADLSRLPSAATAKGLHMLGLVLAATRMQDMRLTSQAQAQAEAADFLDRFFPGGSL